MTPWVAYLVERHTEARTLQRLPHDSKFDQNSIPWMQLRCHPPFSHARRLAGLAATP